jgi:hypothetical protein
LTRARLRLVRDRSQNNLKIDYFDTSLTRHSPDPSDQLSGRVIAITLAKHHAIGRLIGRSQPGSASSEDADAGCDCASNRSLAAIVNQTQPRKLIMPSLLSQKAVLASVSISQWSARKLDKKATEEIHARCWLRLAMSNG